MPTAASAQNPADPHAVLGSMGQQGSFGGLMGAAQVNVGREMQALTPALARMQRRERQDRAGAAAIEARMQPVDLKPWTAQPPAPNPLHAFGSIAGIFAVLASAFTHTPAINAMTGLAAAINARRNNDEEGYKQAYQQWKDNSKVALERAQLENAEMQTALQKLNTDVQAGLADVKAISAKYGDKTSLMLSEAGLFNQLGMVQAARESAAAKMEQVRIQAETFGEEFGFPNPSGGTAGGTAAGPGGAAPGGPAPHGAFKTAKARAAFAGAPPPGAPYADGPPPDSAGIIAQKAWMIAHYKAPPPASMGQNSALAIATMAQVMKFNPNYDATLYAAKTRAVTAFTSGTQGNQVRSFNVSISHLDTLRRLSAALENGDLPAVNTFAQEYARQTGHAAPTSFDAAKRIVGMEVIKAIVAMGGGEGEREAAAKSLAAAQSPKQLLGVIRTYEALMGGQLDGMQRQYEAATGMTDFGSFLSPQAKQAMTKTEADAVPLPTITQGGRLVPDASKLKDGQAYTLPDGRVVKFDEANETLVPVD